MKRIVTKAVLLFCSVGMAIVMRGDQPLQAHEPPAADGARLGGWKLADLSATMNSLRSRSYANGKRLFERAHCATCHRQDNVGNEFGPNLAKLDPRFQPLDILRDILDPSRRIADAKFDFWIFETDSGKVVAGLILKETDQTVQVMEKPLAVAPAVVLKKSEIEQRKMSLMSIMPQGLLDNFTREEIADLVAYVAARGDPLSPLVQPPSLRAGSAYDQDRQTEHE
jgi:putative heme-binding domain-containing protein